jgi:hypothetical protein
VSWKNPRPTLQGRDAKALAHILLSLRNYLDDLEAGTTVDLTALQAEVDLLETNRWLWLNTDGDPGKTLYVGSIDPDVSYTPAVGDVWGQI